MRPPFRAALLFAVMLWGELCLCGPGLASGPVAPRARDFDLGRRIDVNGINLVIANDGRFGFDAATGRAGLYYPRGTGRTLLFSAGLWLGADSSPRVTVAEYTSEYAPGRILDSGLPEPPDSPDLRVYKVVRWTGDPSDSAHVEHTPAELAADPTLDPIAHHSWSEYLAGAATRGAPVRTYRLPATDTPAPDDSVDVVGPEVLGDEMLWCVFNDADPARHTNRIGASSPLGIEVQQTVFAFDRPGPLGSTVFLRYRLSQRSGPPLGGVYAGLWADPDVGSGVDDLLGSDVARSLGYVYNHGDDAVYGSAPPAIGLRILPYASAVTGYIHGLDPQSPQESWNALQGLSFDGSAIVDPVTGMPIRFMFSGNPLTGSGWLDQHPTDKRVLVSALAGIDGALVEAALVVGQGDGAARSVAALRCNADFAQHARASGFTQLEPDPARGPCPFAPSCARPPAFWRDRCLSAPDSLLRALAAQADARSTYFDWGGQLDRMCAALDPKDPSPRREAERQFAALLANVMASSITITDTNGDTVSLQPDAPVSCSGFPAGIVLDLTDPGTRKPALLDVTYDDAGPAPRTLRGLNFGLPFLGGGASTMWDLFGSTLDPAAVPDSFGTVEIRFSHTSTQRAYRFLRHERRDGGPPPEGRAYTYAGFHEVPFQAWDIERGIQFDAAFAELLITDDAGNPLPPSMQPATLDSTWNPDSSDTGGREYLVILRSAYTGSVNPALTADGSFLNATLPALYVLGARRDHVAGADDDGDVIRYVWGQPSVQSVDGRMIDLEDRDPSDPAVQQAYLDVVACLDPLNRHCDATTPVLASFTEISAAADAVTLRGFAPAALALTLEKREAGGPWREAARIVAGGTGAWEWQDRDVVAGARYDYRLLGEGRVLAQVSVEVPRTARLALAGMLPNPGGREAAVRFQLPRAAPAGLELLDIAGRRLLRREVGSLGPGTHTVSWAELARVAPGVYLLRLTQGGETATARVVRIR